MLKPWPDHDGPSLIANVKCFLVVVGFIILDSK